MAKRKLDDCSKKDNTKRNPVTHRTARQTCEHNRTYGEKPRVKEHDKMNHRARRAMKKEGKNVKGKDVSHKKAAVKGGSHKRSNLTLKDRSKNRGHGMSPGGTKKGTSVRRRKS